MLKFATDTFDLPSPLVRAWRSASSAGNQQAPQHLLSLLIWPSLLILSTTVELDLALQFHRHKGADDICNLW